MHNQSNNIKLEELLGLTRFISGADTAGFRSADETM